MLIGLLGDYSGIFIHIGTNFRLSVRKLVPFAQFEKNCEKSWEST